MSLLITLQKSSVPSRLLEMWYGTFLGKYTGLHEGYKLDDTEWCLRRRNSRQAILTPNGIQDHDNSIGLACHVNVPSGAICLLYCHNGENWSPNVHSVTCFAVAGAVYQSTCGKNAMTKLTTATTNSRVERRSCIRVLWRNRPFGPPNLWRLSPSVCKQSRHTQRTKMVYTFCGTVPI